MPTESDLEQRVAARKHAGRIRRVKLNAIAWALGAGAVTAIWVAAQWSANGTWRSFGHEGEPGQWNPTLWAVVVGVWGLVVGLTALRAHFERPASDSWSERLGRVKYHVAAWALAMAVLTPLWAVIEWQDNGAFGRLSNNSQPGDWDPWILVVGGIWLLAVVGIALRTYADRPWRRPTPAR